MPLLAFLGTVTLCLAQSSPQVTPVPLAWVLGPGTPGADLDLRGSSLGPEPELSQVTADPHTCDRETNVRAPGHSG